ncbi:hybrid sensor histidine kinase/response regulator [Pseudodesulfovibrio sp. zrk46]|uniref:hybrid sensor histidine kinase/response regulator n=1 Tax=Pseudodesulfovibrio sp. zrk46 TaxID=2725288 RepID=UPI001449CF6D|nr:hybrid sensor histidine kinase/response regulator [Pseudodesulfovibrio sp. zrk46]QJB58206.1 response regulator [Pseudodesulfovibrio sp. zrk46]
MAVSDEPLAPRILIVEDSKVVYRELKRCIESQLGYDVDVVSSYADADAYLKQNSRNIFLSIVDLYLPDATEGEIVDLFCARMVPTIVFTSDFSEETRKRMMSKDIIDYVVKDARAVENVIDYVKRLSRNRDIKVLVVDDSGSFRFHLSSLLHKQMFQVADVVDAEGALAEIEKNDEYTVVITDYQLPGMDGVALTRKLRELHSKAEMIVIAISTAGDPSLAARFFKTGVNDFLSKPFEAEEFYSRVNHNVDVLETIRALKDADKVKNQFLGMAAHDLRSPINGIHGLSEMLLEDMCGPINEEQREMISYIHSANKHMNSLVNDLLDISVIESGNLKLLKGEAALADMLAERCRIHSLAASRKSTSIGSTVEEVPNFAFDYRRMGQVMDNLLTNAIKFSPHNSKIEVTLGMEDGHAKVCVCDNGQGIPPGEEELLFQNFKKTSVKPTAGESSTGLGLPIVKKIVEAHGGRVWVESVYGQGSSFCFTLPLD